MHITIDVTPLSTSHGKILTNFSVFLSTKVISPLIGNMVGLGQCQIKTLWSPKATAAYPLPHLIKFCRLNSQIESWHVLFGSVQHTP